MTTPRTAPGPVTGDRLIVGRVRRDRATLLRTTALQAAFVAVVALPAGTVPARAQPAPNARPTGGTVVGGSVTIDQSAANKTLVTQSTARGAVDWRTFDVGSSQSVQFAQPNASAITLNRVTAANPSQIAGQISANGQIVIVNQSGVVFFPGSQVNAQSVVISAAGINPKDFMAGSMVFDQAPRPGARIVNQGTLTAGKAGLVGLVAPSVANSGVITARMGHVVLAGAEAHTIDMYGDGLLSIDVTRQVTTLPLGPDGKPVTALVTNTGVIRADGGTVQLTAVAADGLVQTLVNSGGKISARTVTGDDGKLSPGSINIAGTGGSVIVDGALLATGNRPGQIGGQIAVNATNTVTVAKGARISANGRAGGGTIALGTTIARAAGGPAVASAQTARRTLVEAGATISADATGTGSGGNVTLLSTEATAMLGRITAKGGPGGGDGGLVEISGAAIQLGGTVDVTAPHGGTGTILLDPEDLTIAATGGTVLAPGAGNPNIAFNTGGTLTDYVVTPASLAALNGNVNLQASRSLTVASSFSINGGVSLSAGNNLTVQAGTTITSTSTIALAAGVNFGNTLAVAGFNAGATLFLLGDLVTPTLNGGISLNAPTGGVVLGGNVTTSFLQISTTGPVVQTGGVITSQDLSVSGTSVSLPQANALTYLDYITASVGDVTIANGPGTGHVLTVNSISVSTGRTISLSADAMDLSDGAIYAPQGTVILSPASAGFGIEIIDSGTPNTTNTLSLNYGQLSEIVNAATLQLGTSLAPVGPINLGNTGDNIDLRRINQIGDGATGPVSLGFYSTGAVTSGSGATGGLQVDTIYGRANSVNINNSGDQISTIGPLTATNDIVVFGGTNVNVAGPVVAGGTFEITAVGPLQLNGNINAPTVLLISGDFGEETTASIDQLGGSITTANLYATTSNGSISLGGANQVTALFTSFLAGDGTAYLNNTIPLNVPTTAIGGDTTLNVAGAITITGPISGPVGSALSLISTGAVTETGLGAIAVDALSVVGTSVNLPGAQNAVGALNAGTASAGNFLFTDSSSLSVAGTISAVAGGTIALTADAITFDVRGGNEALTTALTVPGGTVALAPQTTGQELDVFAAGTLGMGASGYDLSNVGAQIIASTLQLGSATTGNIVLGAAGSSITLPGITTLRLISGGSITQAGSLTINTLTGSASAATLNGSNTIAVLGGFTTTGGLNFADTTGFLVNAPLTDQTKIQLSSPGSIVLASNITANVLQLGTTGSGAITQTGGSIIATTLIGNGSSLWLPAQFNAITNIGSVTAINDFLLIDSRGLTIAGPLDPLTVSLTVTGPLTISAPVVGTTSVSLIATGAIAETAGGSVTAGTLSGSGASASFAQADNAVTTLDSFVTTGGFTLVNGRALRVTGALSDGVSIALRSLGTLSLAGNVTAPAVSLTANSVTGGGTILSRGDVVQSAGTIAGATQIGVFADGAFSQTGGALVGGTLSGSAGSTVSAPGTANLIATLGSFSSTGGFALTDGQALAITGPVTDTARIALSTTAGGMGFAGVVNAPTIALASAGAISQTGGSLVATLLSGSGAGVSLGQTTNSVATLGGFASTGGFLLADAAALSVTGPVTAAAGSTLTLLDNAPALGVGGSLSAGATGTVVLAPLTAGTAFTLGGGGGIGGTPAVTAGTLVIGSTVAGPVSIAGAFNLATVATLDVLSAGAITEAAGSGVSVGALTGAGSSITLGGTNSIATLGGIAAPGGLTLVDGRALSVTGPVTAAAGVTLNVTGALTLAGAVTTTGTASLTATGAITQTAGSLVAATLTDTATSTSLPSAANAIATLAATTNTTSFLLVDSRGLTVAGALDPLTVSLTVTGPLTISAPVVGTTSVSLIATGAIAETAGGSVTAGTLSGSGASASFAQAGNAVTTLGSFATTGGFTLIDGTALSVTGPLTDGVSIALRSLGTLSLAGNVTAPAVSLTANSVTGGGTILSRGDVVQSAGTIAGATQIGVFADGAFSQTGGALVGGTLSGSAGSTVSAPGTANLIATLGSFSSTGGFALTDGQALAITGPVTDTARIALSTTAGGMGFAGVVNAPTIALASAGAISQTGGSLVATLLSGSGAGVSLGQTTNSVATLGGFASTGGFLLADAAALSVTGPVTAAAGSTLTLLDNAPALGVGGSLSAGATGTVVLAPLTAGTAFTLGGGGGIGGTPAVTAGTLVIGSTVAGPVSIAGAFNLATVATLDVLSAGAITEAAGSGVSVGALTGAGSSITLGGTNSIATLGGIAAPGGLTLVDGRALSVTGPVTAAAGVTLNVTGALTLAGAVTTTGTASLTATGAITQTAGSLVAATLTDTATSTSLPSAANAIATLAATTNTTSFLLVDSRGLTVAGALDPLTVSLTVTGPLTISAPVVGTTSVSLIATGAIAETAGGSVTAGTLSGSGASASFAQAGNAVTTLGSFATTGGFTLFDGTALSVTGPLTDGVSIALRSLGTLSLAGNVTAPAVSLTANSVTGGGTILSRGDVVQSAGTIAGATQIGVFADGAFSQTGGALVGGTLSGSAGSTVSAPGTANLIATLGSFSSTGGFALTDGQALAITGPVTDTARIALSTTAGGMGFAGVVNAPTIALASAGAISQTGGSLVATLLSGSGAGVSLGQTTNSVATLGGFASTGGFLLADAAALSVTGPVTAAAGSTLTLLDNAPALGVGGSLSAGATGTVVLAPLTAGTAFTLGGGGGIGGTPAVTAGTLVIGSTVAGPVSIAGAFNLATVATLDVLSAGAITEAAGSGVSVGALTGAGSSITLGGTNSIATLGGIAAPGGLTLVDGRALSVTGPVTAAAGVTLNVTGALTLAGAVTTTGTASLTATGAITQTAGSLVAATLTDTATSTSLPSAANAIATLAATTNTTSFLLVDSRGLTVAGALDPLTVSLTVTGPLTISAPVVGTTSVSLIATGAIAETAGGSVTAGTLSGSGASASFAQAGNAVTTLGSFATTGGFTLIDGTALSVTGPLTDGVSIALRSLGTLSLAGNVTAPAVSLTANSVTGGGTILSRGDVVQSAGTIAGATQIGVFADGAFSQTGGALVGGTLSGSAGSTVSAPGTANLIATLGSFSSTGGFALTDGQALAITGPVTDTARIALSTTAGGMGFAGVVNAPTIALASAGAISQTGGSLVATLLSGSGAGVSLGQTTNSVATLGGFASTGGFLLADAAALSVTGPVTAAAGSTLTLLDNAPALGVGGSLSAGATGTVVLAPLTAGTAFTLGGGGGIGGTPAVTAGTLVIGSTVAGPVSIAGAFNLATVATLDVLSAGAITEAAGSGVSVGALTGAGSSITLGGTNSIATLGGIAAPGGLTLVDGRALSVTGPVTAAAGVTLNVTGALTLAGAVTTTGTASLTATGAITQTAGSLVAATLTDTATSTSLPSATNAIATLAATTNTTSFLLVDSRGLTVAGALDPLTVSLTVTGPLTISAPVVGTTSVSLIATGAIAETAGGSVTAGTLSGSGASASFAQAGNAVTTLGSFATTGGFTLIDGTALSVTGPLTDGVSIALRSLGTLSLAGNVTAPAVSLTANSVTGGGTILSRGDVVQSAGTIAGATQIGVFADGAFSQTGGALVGGTLSGSAGSTVSAPGTANLIATLGSFSSTGGFALTDGQALAITGPVTDTARIALSVAGAATLAGNLSAPLVSLTATGAISQTGGSMTAGSLGITAAGVSLGQATNSIGTLTASSSSGNLLIADAKAVTIAGTISVATGGTLTLADDMFSFGPGGVLSAPAGTVILQPLTAGDPIALGGANAFAANAVVNANLLVIGSTTAGPITITGAVNFAGVPTLGLFSGSTITETGTGAITVASLTGSGTVVSLTGSNSIATLGGFSATALSLVDTSSLAVAGAVSVTGAGGLTLTTPGDLAINGPVASSSVIVLNAGGTITEPGSLNAQSLSAYGADVRLTGGNAIAALGVSGASNGFVLVDGQALTVTGAVSAAQIALSIQGSLALNANVTAAQVSLAATGAISQAAGVLSAGTLSGSAASANLPYVTVAVLGGFATRNGLTLIDSEALTVTGPVTDGRSIVLTTMGALTVAGTIAAPSVALTANNGTNSASGGLVTGDIQLSSGLVSGSTAVSLTAAGRIVQTNAVLSAGNLTGSAGSTASLTNPANTVATLGGFVSQTGFALVDGVALTLTGPVTDGSAVSVTTNGSLALAGTIAAPSVRLFAGGAISQTAGAITATSLTGSGAGVTLGQATNQIATLGSFASSGNFLLADGGPLTLSATVSTATGATLTIQNDALTFTQTALLSAPGGTAVLTPLQAGDAMTLAGSGATPSVQTNTLVIGASNAGPLTIAGSFDFSGATTVTLLSTGAITESGTGSIKANTVMGTGASAILGGANSIAALGSFTSAGALTLNDLASLAITGPVRATTLTLTDGGAISQTGLITATLLTGSSAGSTNLGLAGNAIGTLAGYSSHGGFTLNTGALTVTGPVSDTASISLTTSGPLTLNGKLAAPTVNLASAGAIAQPGGAISATLLTIGQGAGVSLGSSANQVANLGNAVSTGDFLLADGAAITVTGGVSAGTGRLVTIAADTISFGTAGRLNAPGGTVTLQPLNMGDALNLASGGGVNGTQAVGADRLIIGAANAGSVTIGGLFNFTGAAVVDLRSAAAISETATGGIATNTLVASAGGSITLNAADLTNPGNSANQIATLGALSSGGSVTVANNVPLVLTGTIAATAGQAFILADSITLAPGAFVTAAGPVVFGPRNAGDSMLVTSTGTAGLVSASGVVIGGYGFGTANILPSAVTLSGAFDFTGANQLTVSATGAVMEAPGAGLSVATLQGSAGSASLAGTNIVATLGGFTSATGFVFTDTTALRITGAVTDGVSIALGVAGDIGLAASVSAPSVSLAAQGAILQTAGTLTAGTLSGLAASATLNGSNGVASLGTFGTTGTFSLADTQNLTITGPVSASALSLTTSGGIVFAGNVSAATVQLSSGGAISSTGGTLNTALLTGSSALSAQFGRDDGTAVAGVQNLGTFIVGAGSLSLANSGTLTVLGPLSAGTIAISALGSLELAGGMITTDKASFQVNAATGTLVPTLTQSATTTFVPLRGTTGTLTLQVGNGGSIQLSDLEATAFALTLNVGAGGTASGKVAVGSLTVIGSSGSADLTGTVDGVAGFPTAIISRINPGFDITYQINNCAIMSASCTALASTLFNPTTFLRPDLITLDLLTLAVTPDPKETDELLPNISRRDN